MKEHIKNRNSCKNVESSNIKNRKFLYKILLPIYRFCVAPFCKIRFEYNIRTKKPYFGYIFSAEQCWPERRPVMRKLINHELQSADSKYKILEIGAWAGHSTFLWANLCKEKNKGIVYCIDTWKAAKNSPKKMQNAVKGGRIFKLFLHNIKTSGLEDYVFPIKCSSNLAAEMLKPNTFNFIYIDGDHAYSQFKRDLLNYMKLVKVNGVICGDDLEALINEVDVQNAKDHCEEDCIIDPTTNKQFHPGITLGINEIFGNNISMKNGFWFMRKVRGGWEPISL